MEKSDKHRTVNARALILLLWTGVGLLWPSSGVALDPAQVTALKKAGVSDQTIQMMIRQEMAAQEQDGMGVKEIRDKDGQVITVYSTGPAANTPGDTERENADKAWKMLQNIIIDGRR
ncbi:MAG TPA: hypothetical protein PLH54_00995 [Syntrophales bacterium]|nr:hypothetical protein [Syntrophales bacterium]HON22194.1 hypothetical protein [Syntrophales bacterium]HOU77035.1 hypothetical protein [Syntrophales bacterium]HPC32952.1 hypothetical protein [Syntrophales bacterium]HQI36676.1 hypothetical protein [Syntrophales bacterium]